MTREERDKICLSCKHHTFEERYGVLCGLTENYANYKDSCKDFSRKISINNNTEEEREAPIFKTSKSKDKKKKGFGALIGKGIGIWIIIKIIFTIIRSFTE
ncbi:hypothetical protein [Lacinutrix undariae]